MSMIQRLIAVGCALIFLAGCQTDRSAARVNLRGHIYLFRGFADASFGLDGFAQDLRGSGFNATCNSDGWGHVIAERIERDYAKVSGREPLILIGYSTGSVTAVAIAKRLNQTHIPVDLLVTLDPVISETVPGNVGTCLNYYEQLVPGVTLLSGTMMRAEPSVKLQNIKLTRSSHFTINVNPEMRSAVTAQIAALCTNPQGER